MPKETADGEPYKPGQTKELNMEAADTEALITLHFDDGNFVLVSELCVGVVATIRPSAARATSLSGPTHVGTQPALHDVQFHALSIGLEERCSPALSP